MIQLFSCILTFLVSLRLISHLSNRRSVSFLAAGRKEIPWEGGKHCGHSGGFHPSCRRHTAVTGILNCRLALHKVLLCFSTVERHRLGQVIWGQGRRSMVVWSLDQNVLTDSQKYYVNTCFWDPTWHHCDAALMSHHSRVIFTVLSLLVHSNVNLFKLF